MTSSEFVTLGKFSKILRLFLDILVKVRKKQFFKKSVPEDIRHWNQGGPPKFWIENQITYQNKKIFSVLSELQLWNASTDFWFASWDFYFFIHRKTMLKLLARVVIRHRAPWAANQGFIWGIRPLIRYNSGTGVQNRYDRVTTVRKACCSDRSRRTTAAVATAKLITCQKTDEALLMMKHHAN